jgi:hypothetical protein
MARSDPRIPVPPPGEHSAPLARSVTWLLRNRRTGGITVAQWPNLPLYAFLASEIALRFVRSGDRAAPALRAVAVVAILVWAADEIARGVNPFRRMLGAAVALATITGLVLH